MIERYYQRMVTALRFHGERLRILPWRYPRYLAARNVGQRRLVFKVHNFAEANRVRSLDGEKQILQMLLAELRPSDVFLDVGACVGVYALHAARYCQQVIALEPEPELRAHLAENVELNQAQNIMLLPYALADKSGKVPLYTEGSAGKSPSILPEKEKQAIWVEGRSLDDLVQSRKIPYPDVVKIDIEGAELIALQGMQNLLSERAVRAIFLEVHPLLLANMGGTPDGVLQLLKKAGFSLVYQSARDVQQHWVLRR
ncbi:FkbM family methyltransferase [Candidatus Parcubacteria bacterium]|nr:MAG: FkbM family methyltransferase [Candidatus Parcubacteria bacterium]